MTAGPAATTALPVPAGTAAPTGAPPVAEPRPGARTVHGTTWDDPYEWLRGTPELDALLDAETLHAEAALAPLDAEVSALVEAAGRELVTSELGFPQRRDGRWWAPAVRPGARYPRLLALRLQGADGARVPSAAEVEEHGEVVVDLDALLGDATVVLGTVQVSPCGRYVAWTQDATGGETFTVRVARVGSQDPAEVRTVADGTAPGVLFDATGDRLLVVGHDDGGRPASVRVHAVAAPEDGTVLLDEPDPTRRVRVELTTSGAFVVLTSASRDAGTCAVLPADDLTGTPRPVPADPGTTTVAHVVVAGADHLLVTTTAPSGQTSWLAPVRDGGPAPRDVWTQVLRSGPEEAVSPPLVLRDHVLVGRRETGRDALHVGTWADGPRLELRPVAPVASVGVRLAVQPEWTDRHVVVQLASYVRRPAAYRVDLDAPDVPPSRVAGPADDADDYVERLEWATAADGTRVPVTLVARRDLAGPAPTYLTGYGAYGAVLGPTYNPMLRHLLDRGVVYAVAHVRGGGELGRAWHTAARGADKTRSFTDLLDCLDHLVASGTTDPDRVVAAGGSAGGLLVGAALNLAPERFRGAVLDVPFLDPLTSMLDPGQRLTVSDRLEWGDPVADPEAFATIRAYSPYENVPPGARWPAVLVTCRRADQRVGAVEAAKWVQRVRATTTGGPVLLRALAGGHTGSPEWRENVRKLALDHVWAGRLLTAR
ncbi:prolyl oligopeptidase family serine peptidase [Cellulomonas telluris]|uniref:prolyl oligopeptidase family serine peptidase n=1 Tax=Cellulomonas telluris TaxID=2306636 RepID=UPI0014562EEC|nr:prolyl oligopeptidase family serine peptidase [Cellulomonas telluris]